MTKNDRVVVSFPLDLSEMVAICLALSKSLPTILINREALGVGVDELLLLTEFNTRLTDELNDMTTRYSPEDLKILITNGRREAVSEAQKHIGREIQAKTGIRLPPPYNEEEPS